MIQILRDFINEFKEIREQNKNIDKYDVLSQEIISESFANYFIILPLLGILPIAVGFYLVLL